MRGARDTDGGAFFPDPGAGEGAAIGVAKRVCAGCPVRARCLGHALDREEPHGDPEQSRSCLWQGIQVFSLCCMDCTCTLGGRPPNSLTWSTDASFHVVLDNAHYSGPRGQGLWDVGRASTLTRGLGNLVRLPTLTNGQPGVAVVAFFVFGTGFGVLRYRQAYLRERGNVLALRR